MKNKKLITTFVAAAMVAATSTTATATETETLKLYALDCGTIDMFDMAPFSANGEFAGKRQTLANPCFLIRHPKGDLIWDTGFSETLADSPDGIKLPWGHISQKAKLTDQLATLDLAPDDIEYIALSHQHEDHAGNAGLFADSTWLADKTEHSAMFSDAARANTGAFEAYGKLETAKTVTFDGTHDVFGDQSVVIKSMHGHTAGHSVLMLQLPTAGTLLLSGDLYIVEASRAMKAVPAFNFDKEASAASIEAFEALAAENNARVIIQHDKATFDALPKFPAYLD